MIDPSFAAEKVTLRLPVSAEQFNRDNRRYEGQVIADPESGQYREQTVPMQPVGEIGQMTDAERATVLMAMLGPDDIDVTQPIDSLLTAENAEKMVRRGAQQWQQATVPHGSQAWGAISVEAKGRYVLESHKEDCHREAEAASLEGQWEEDFGTPNLFP